MQVLLRTLSVHNAQSICARPNIAHSSRCAINNSGESNKSFTLTFSFQSCTCMILAPTLASILRWRSADVPAQGWWPPTTSMIRIRYRFQTSSQTHNNSQHKSGTITHIASQVKIQSTPNGVHSHVQQKHALRMVSNYKLELLTGISFHTLPINPPLNAIIIPKLEKPHTVPALRNPVPKMQAQSASRSPKLFAQNAVCMHITSIALLMSIIDRVYA